MTNLPHICAICCTFGRTAELSEAVACFHSQKYDGKKTLVIFNSLVNQTIVYEHPEVIVVNAKERPMSMGATRNEAIKHAPDGCLLVTWDDDDRYCSNHLANFARGFDITKHGWVRHSRQFHMDCGVVKSAVHGSANTVAFTKEAWEEVGGYHELNTGEDQQFIGRLTAAYSGVTVELKDDELSFLYGWAQGAQVYHISGGGVDRPGMPNGMQRCLEHVQKRQEALYEPTGEVVLKPKLLKDYDQMARAFIDGVTRLSNGRRGKIAMVCLGHAGDLMNVLPIAHHIFKTTGIKPMFFTSKMYGDVLDGVSYVEPVKMDLHDKDIRLAIAEAQKRAEVCLTTQVHGEGYQVERLCESYNQEAWRMAGMLPHFADTQNFPLVFDRRDAEREAKIMAQHFKPNSGIDFWLQPTFPQYRKIVEGEEVPLDGTETDETEIIKYDRSDSYKKTLLKLLEPGLKTTSKQKPVALLNLTGGLSSPFSYGGMLESQIMAAGRLEWDFLDLSKIRAERIYDMLAILERGTVLVSSDTYTLHLAAACDIPVIAITNDTSEPFGRPWLRTTPRCNCILQLGYSDGLSRIEEINQKIGEI